MSLRLPLYAPSSDAVVDFHNDADSTIKLVEGGVGSGTTTALVFEWLMVGAVHPDSDCVWMTEKSTFHRTGANTLKAWSPDEKFDSEFDTFSHPNGRPLRIVDYETFFPRPDYLFLELGHCRNKFERWDDIITVMGTRSQMIIESKPDQVPQEFKNQMSCYLLPQPQAERLLV